MIYILQHYSKRKILRRIKLPSILVGLFFIAFVFNVHGTVGPSTYSLNSICKERDTSANPLSNVEFKMAKFVPDPISRKGEMLRVNLNFSADITMSKRDHRIINAWMLHKPFFSRFWRYFIEMEKWSDKLISQAVACHRIFNVLSAEGDTEVYSKI